MRRKRMFWIAAVAAAGLLAVLLMGLLLGKYEEKKMERISRKEAARALALAMAEPEEICQSTGENDYEEYLILRGRMKKGTSNTLTVADLELFLEQEALYPSGMIRRMGPEIGRKSVSRSQFWEFYQLLAKDPERGLSWDEGVAAAYDEEYIYLKEKTLKVSEYDVSPFLDQKVTYYKKGDILVGVVAETKGEVSYENVLVTGIQGEDVVVFLYGGYRTFDFPGSEKMYQDAVLDVKLQNQKVVEVRVKSEEIRAKVLRVDEESIELQGYGTIPFSQDFVMYKGYGNYGIQTKKDIHAGYQIEKFFVAEGKVCAGLTTQTLDAERIRVIITTTGFASRFHENVTITCEDAFTVSQGGKTVTYEAGEMVSFSMDSQELLSERAIIRPKRESFPLRVTSITRNSGHPEYLGTLELKKYEEGIVLLNEVLVEDYLLTVVPSEVPSSFQKEALNVQAITARTYACRAIEENACWEYGAHVDDSENFQVYGNVTSNPQTEAAVRDTYGQVLQYGEQMAVIYYFSTSCGATTGPEIWGGSLTTVPYMEPKWIGTGSSELDLRNEEDARKYLSAIDEDAYEKECEWFRWSTEVSFAQLTQSVNQNLAARQALNPSLILVKGGNGYQEKRIQTIGDVQAIEVRKRGSGGTVETIYIQGSEAEIQVSGQTNIRTLLGNAECVYQTMAGTSDTYRSLLQSSFFYLEPIENGYRICGGGKGHGLGMPQNGMNQMALSGMTAENILQFFFAGTSLLSIY